MDFSIHALLAESDADKEARKRLEAIFLSTLSLRRATFGGRICQRNKFLFYPRSPCGERHQSERARQQSHFFSIHALLAESDHPKSYLLHSQLFSIHALLAESDPAPGCLFLSQGFSIHALLAESDPGCGFFLMYHFFYPRSPCGERLWPGLLARPFFIFSIHALLAESDPGCGFFFDVSFFLSTLSLRRATSEHYERSK